MSYRLRRQGFSLIEWLITLVAICILVLICVPRLLIASRKAKETTLRIQYTLLQEGVDNFQQDLGDFPSDLGQLFTRPQEGTKGGRGKPLDIGKWQGPYYRPRDGEMVTKLPVSPFLMKTLTGKEEPGNAGNGWNYNPKTGEVHPASTMTTLDGKTKYSER